MTENVEKEVELPCSPGEAWEQIIDPSWLGVEGDMPTSAGDEGWVNDGEVTRYLIAEEVVEERRYVYRWATFEEPPTRVAIELTPTSEGTHISISESPLDVRAQASLVLQ
jgi:hypothetical protein